MEELIEEEMIIGFGNYCHSNKEIKNLQNKLEQFCKENGLYYTWEDKKIDFIQNNDNEDTYYDDCNSIFSEEITEIFRNVKKEDKKEEELSKGLNIIEAEEILKCFSDIEKEIKIYNRKRRDTKYR